MNRYHHLPADLLRDGYRISKTAHGESMLPVIGDGSRLLLEPAARRRPKLGDVVYFRSEGGQTLIHRVYARRTRGGRVMLYTWGDNCREPDPPVAAAAVSGVVVALQARGAREAAGSWQPLPGRKRYYFSLCIRKYTPGLLRLAGRRTLHRLRRLCRYCLTGSG